MKKIQAALTIIHTASAGFYVIEVSKAILWFSGKFVGGFLNFIIYVLALYAIIYLVDY
jgi:hypothetical protein